MVMVLHLPHRSRRAGVHGEKPGPLGVREIMVSLESTPMLGCKFNF